MDFINWLVTSSADPNKLSLTVRGALLAIAPIAIYFLGFSDADFNGLVDAIVEAITLLSALVAAIQVIFGLLRKINFRRWSAAR